MDTPITLEEVLRLASKLPLKDKVRLIEQVAPQIQRDIQSSSRKPRRTLKGIWRGLNITEADINEARREAWGDFPRQDV